MAGANPPGPAGSSTRTQRVDDGTLARTPTPSPAQPPSALAVRQPNEADSDWLDRGSIPYAIGQSAVVRIPVPGTAGLAIEFRPRGWVPQAGSTSTLFIQELSGKRHLRLDFGFNVKTGTIDYHWNQKSTFDTFRTADHAPAGAAGKVAHQAARHFRYAGRVLLVAGVAMDLVSIVQSSKPLRRASQVVAGWAAAWVGCKLVGAGGAAAGMLASPLGGAAGGIGGCIIGGAAGYWGASSAAGVVYDWAEDTFFIPLPEIQAP